MDRIWFEDSRKERLAVFLASEAKKYLPALEATTEMIDGFESPSGMELLGTVDWLLDHDQIGASVEEVKAGLGSWRGGAEAAERKMRLFDDGLIELALARLAPTKSGLEGDARGT